MFDLLMILGAALSTVLGSLAYSGIWRSWANLEEGRLEPWRWEIRHFPIGGLWLGGGVLMIYILSALQVRRGLWALLYFVAVGGMAVAVVMAHYIPKVLYPRWILRSASSVPGESKAGSDDRHETNERNQGVP